MAGTSVVTRDRSTSGRCRFGTTFAGAWVLTVVGAGLCAPLSVGLLTIEAFAVMVPIGMVAGAILGVLVGAVIGVALAGSPRPPADAGRFSAGLGLVGAVLALGINLPLNVWTVVVQSTNAAADPFQADTRPKVLGLVLVAVGCVLGSAMVGKVCGHLLARICLWQYGVARPTR